MDDEHGLRLVGSHCWHSDGAFAQPDEHRAAFRIYPGEVLLALKIIQTAERSLSASNQRKLTQAIDVLDECADLHRQLTAAAAADKEARAE